MRKSKKIISAALTTAALSLLAIPTFAASSSDGIGDYLPAIIIAGVVVIAVIAIASILSGNKKKKAAAAAAKAKAEAEKKAAEAQIIDVEVKEDPKPAEEQTDAEQITNEPEITPAEPEMIEVESEEEPAPSVDYEAPVQIESVEVVTEPKPEVIDIPTVEVEDTTPVAEAVPEEMPETPTVDTVETVAASELAEGEFRDPETGCVYTFGADGVPVPPDGMVIRYKWSFLGRLFYSDNTVKYRYMMLRRLLLSYKKVRSNVSWNFDSYFLGRKPLVKIKVRGKYLVVYFNLDPAEMAGTKYVGEDVSKVSRYKAVPFAYKINGERKLQYAMELVRKIMEDAPSVEPEFIEPGQAKYAIPSRSFAELFGDGYIKIGGFLAVSRAASVSDDDDEDGPVTDTADADEDDAAIADENVAPIDPEVFNYTPSKKDA